MDSRLSLAYSLLSTFFAHLESLLHQELAHYGVDMDIPQRWYVHEIIVQTLTENFNPCWHALIESGCFCVEKGEDIFFKIELRIVEENQELNNHETFQA